MRRILRSELADSNIYMHVTYYMDVLNPYEIHAYLLTYSSAGGRKENRVNQSKKLLYIRTSLIPRCLHANRLIHVFK